MSESTDGGDAILEMRHIVKTFPGVRALDDVDFTVARGEIQNKLLLQHQYLQQ